MLNELCRKRREELKMPYKEIADKTGLSQETIEKYMLRTNSKAPSVYTVGPICAALGISLDEYFGINPPIKTDAEKLEEKERRIGELEARLNYSHKTHTALLYALVALAICCVLFFVYAMTMDAFTPLKGLIRG